MNNWLVPANKLDTKQNEFLTKDLNRNWFISGFPGSGKSVLLAHVISGILRRNNKASIALVLYTHALISMYRELQLIVEKESKLRLCTLQEFTHERYNSDDYDYILCDEVQDCTPTQLKVIQKRAKHVIIAGDVAQSIYRYKITPSEICPTTISQEYLLNENHRLGRHIIDAVYKLCPNMENMFCAKVDMTKQSAQIRLCKAKDEDQEIDYVYKKCKDNIDNLNSCAIIVPSRKKAFMLINKILKKKLSFAKDKYGKIDMDKPNAELKKNNIPLQYLGSGYGEFADMTTIKIMTYHSAKGLDFDNVYLIGLNETDSLFNMNDEDLEKRIFMVGMTRSRLNLYITYTGILHRYVQTFENQCHKIDIDNINQSSTISFGGLKL